MGKYVISLKII